MKQMYCLGICCLKAQFEIAYCILNVLRNNLFSAPRTVSSLYAQVQHIKRFSLATHCVPHVMKGQLSYYVWQFKSNLC